MKELDVEEIINMNYRVLTLLGIATSIVMDYRKSSQCIPDRKTFNNCSWFINAVQAVIYENKPLPEMP